ncbi:MAG: hypothetical protein ABI702_12980 [Burkholderiales bacterium]
MGDEIKLLVKPETFRPDQRTCAAAVFFGGSGGADIDVSKANTTGELHGHVRRFA